MMQQVTVMRGLDPGLTRASIVFAREEVLLRGMDCRVKPGNDELDYWIVRMRGR